MTTDSTPLRLLSIARDLLTINALSSASRLAGLAKDLHDVYGIGTVAELDTARRMAEESIAEAVELAKAHETAALADGDHEQGAHARRKTGIDWFIAELSAR